MVGQPNIMSFQSCKNDACIYHTLTVGESAMLSGSYLCMDSEGYILYRSAIPFTDRRLWYACAKIVRGRAHSPVSVVSRRTGMDDCYYFSFGSNMSTWRIAKNCPAGSAPVEFVGTARLEHYALNFSGPDWPSWRGAPANVTGDEGNIVWGVLWRVSPEHLHHLDMWVQPYVTSKFLTVTFSDRKGSCTRE